MLESFFHFPLQVSTPVELPAVTLAPKQETPKAATFTPPPAALKVLSTNQKVPVAANPVLVSDSKVSSSAAEPSVEDDDGGDDELDQLLSLQKPVSGVTDEDSVVPDKACEEVKEEVPEVTEEKMEELKDVKPPKSASIKKEVTEEDLEDWLDSMIS